MAASAIQRLDRMLVAGPQNSNSGKGPSAAVQLVAQVRGRRVAVRQLAAVRLVDRPRRHADVVARPHVVPPEQVGAGEGRVALLARLPNLLAGDQAVRLAPEPDLHEVPEQPSVRDDAVIARRQPGREGRLDAAGDGRGHRRERADRAGGGEAGEVRRELAEVPGREADDEQDERAMHGRSSPKRTPGVDPRTRRALAVRAPLPLAGRETARRSS